MVHSFLNFQDLSSEERIAVTQLKQKMLGHMDSKMYDDLSVIVRFLRARDLNVSAAENMLKNHLEWRKINQVDNIVTNYVPKEVFQEYLSISTMGFDKEGAPILYIDVGNLDTKGLLKCARKIDAMKCIVQRLERYVMSMQKQSEKYGRLIDKWMMVVNFDNLTFAIASHKATLEIIVSLVMMYEANYPERLKAAYFINASVYFSMAFPVIKPFLSARTYRKIHIYNKDGWKEELLKVIDDDVLPAFLGGKRTDENGDPKCKTVVIHGGIVPSSYYIIKKKTSLVSLPDVQTLIISRMSKTQVEMTVTKAGSHLEWEFETKTRDIGFSLLYKKNKFDPHLRELIPKQRIDTGICSEIGMLHCHEPGIYVIQFDNSYSWIFNKEVYCRISVKEDMEVEE